MRILSLIFVFSFMLVSGYSQDFPHGDDFEIDCELCHNPEGWGFDKANFTFDHNTAKFALVGQHTQIDCRLCHKSLVFSQAIPECASCHQDMHYQTVGLDCCQMSYAKILAGRECYRYTSNGSFSTCWSPLRCRLFTMSSISLIASV